VLNVYDDGVLSNSYIHTDFCGSYTSGSFMVGQDHDTYEGSLEAAQAPNMYLDTVAVYSTAWASSYVSSTSGSSCVDVTKGDLYSLYVPGSSSTVYDVMGNNPQAIVAALDVMSKIDGVVGAC